MSARSVPIQIISRPVLLLAVLIAVLVLISSSKIVSADNDPGTSKSSEDKPAKAPEEKSYLGSEGCKLCHEKQFDALKFTKMGMILLKNPRTPLEARGCEACHGPGRAHAEGGGDTKLIIRFGETADHSEASRKIQEDQCLQCHEKGNRLFWEGSPHESRGLTCVTCHKVMTRAVASDRFVEPLTDNRNFGQTTRMEVCFGCHKMRRAQLLRSSHMPFREGKVTCTSCHNPHGTANEKQLIESTANENCYKCHTERRGPFLWEHPPVMESCLNCHEAHGSSHPQLLKSRTPRLCQRCHIESRHPTTPQLAAGRFVFNRSCTNCHSQIHGSNHPSGMRFQR